MGRWRASIGACGFVAASSATIAVASPIAELEKLLLQQQAQASASSPSGFAIRPKADPVAADGNNPFPWHYAILERNRRVPAAAVDLQSQAALPPPAETSSALSSSVGCIVGGTTGVALASLAGGLNTINLIGGGVVSAVNPVTFYVSMMGLVFGSFCQLGSALTPLYVHLTTPAPEPVIGPPMALPPQREPEPRLDDLPDFRRGVPYQSGVPMVRAADRPAGWMPAERVIEHKPCVQDRRSIRLALSTMIHGEIVPPSCAGSLI